MFTTPISVPQDKTVYRGACTLAERRVQGEFIEVFPLWPLRVWFMLRRHSYTPLPCAAVLMGA